MLEKIFTPVSEETRVRLERMQRYEKRKEKNNKKFVE
jgi:hypothetical protein